MNKPSQSLLALVFVLSFQAAFTFCFFYPTIIKWGATEELASTSLFGDEYADDIRSTRAIRINATQGEVWQCLVSLGAERKGFYSYYLLEYLFGCKVNEQYLSNNNTLAIGRLVPIKYKDKDGIFSTGFKVVGIKDKQALVLDG